MTAAVWEYGAGAALVEVGSARGAAALAAWLRPRVRALDVVPGARTVLVDGASVAQVRSAIAGFSHDPAAEDAGPEVVLPVVFDGPDLGFVAERWGVPVAEVVVRMCSHELVSAFCGFAPGFAYLSGLPEAWSVPRRETPRPRVPPGSVALAGEWCGVYPSASPGGWRILGRTDAVLWDAGSSTPALLAPGTRVRFRDAAAR
jgi:KipI family sensor histidine kinase inhibitor